jgi:trk system potassium uptake protein TrkA
MYIIVIGGGRVGYYLTKVLLGEGYEVVIIEKDANVCKIINDELGGVCIRGDGCEASTLAEQGTSRADMLIAVTGDDEDNLVACQVAKYRFNVARTIARIRNPQNDDVFRKLGIDITVDSTNVILEHIKGELPTHPMTHLKALRETGLEIVEVRILPESKTVGKKIKELSLPEGSKLSLIIHHSEKPRLPSADTTIKEGDRIIAITAPEQEEALREELSGT